MNERNKTNQINDIAKIILNTEKDVALSRGIDETSQTFIQQNPHVPANSYDCEKLDSSQTQTQSQIGLSKKTSMLVEHKQIKSKQQWTTEQYRELMWCFYYAQTTNIADGVVKGTYNIWRKRNPDIFLHINQNTLSNQRRFIMSRKKLTDIEIQQIQKDIKQTFQTEALDSSSTSQQTSKLQQLTTVKTELKVTSTSSQNKDYELLEMEQRIRQKMVDVENSSLKERKNLKKVRPTKDIIHQINIANTALTKISRSNCLNLTQVNQLMYATAAVIAGEVKQKTSKKNITKEPAWKRRIQNTIESFRKDLALISEYKKGVSTRQVGMKIENILKKYNAEKENLIILEQNIKMKIQAKAQRLRRYTKRSNYYHQNKIFNEDAKKFYRQLNNQNSDVIHPPSQENVTKFWRGILEDEVAHNDKANWITLERKKYEQINPDVWKQFTTDEITKVIKQTHNWKAPGQDKLQNFWLKQLSSLHEDLTRTFNEIINEPRSIPMWLTSGTTFLISKGKNTEDPKNYRPITCLPTTYKILTAALTNRIYDHLQTNKILPDEQKGCCRKSRGCKDQLLISKMVLSLTKKHLRNLSIAWIDYRKAFDSIPHTWIATVMEIYGICPTITQFIEASMKEWKTEMWLYYSGGHIKTGNITIKRGIFQGDSLSPLLFCLALIPLTNMLNRQNIGFKIEDNNKVNHLLYIDDLKLFGKDDCQLKQSLTIVKEFSDDIKMEFGLDKCAMIALKRGKIIKSQNIHLNEQIVIRNMEMHETYKYLGVNENDDIDNTKMKYNITKEYFRRIRQIFKTELNSKNKIIAINTLAVPVVTYSFGIVDWLRTDIKKMDRKTRKNLTIGGIHHPKADVERLYVKRRNGGRGLIELESAYDAAIVGLCNYIRLSKDRLIRCVKDHDINKAKYSLQKEAQKIKNRYLKQTNEIQNMNVQLKNNIEKDKIEILKNKPLHGQFFRELEKPFVDQQASMQWLRSSGLKGETESLIIAAQDQALNTRYHQKNILKQKVDSKCRLCSKAEESISHIVAGCTTLASSEYTHRHNRVASYVHWTMCKNLGIQVSSKYYEHQPMKVINENNCIIMWDVPIITDRTIQANRPDIVLHNKNEKTCMLIDIAVPNDSNIMLKETEKISKYKDLEIEISRMWNCKTRTVPIIVGALGVLKKGYDENLKILPGHPSANEVQKIALMGTAHILRKVLG